MALTNFFLLLVTGMLALLFARLVKRAASSLDNTEKGNDLIAWEGGIAMGALFFYIPGLLILGLTGHFDKPVFKNVNGLVDISLEEHFTAILMFIGLVVAVYAALLVIRHWPVVRRGLPQIDHAAARFFVLALALYVASLAVDVAITGVLSGGSHWYEARNEAMSGSMVNILLIYIKHASRLLYFSGLLALWRTKRLSTMVFVPVWILSLSFDVYLSGNRFVIAATAFMFFFYLVAEGKWKQVALTMLGAIPVAWFATIFMQARGTLYSRDGTQPLLQFFKNTASESTSTFVEYLSNAFEGINFNTFVSIFYDVPNKIPFLGGESFLKVLVFWIPRSVWDNKMLRAGQVLGDFYVGTSDISIVATLPGEAWLNFGYFALLAVPILVFIAFRVFTLAFASLPATMRFPLIFMFSFSLCRASFAALMIDAIVTSGLIFVITLLARKRLEVFGRHVTVP